MRETVTFDEIGVGDVLTDLTHGGWNTAVVTWKTEDFRGTKILKMARPVCRAYASFDSWSVYVERYTIYVQKGETFTRTGTGFLD